MSDSALPLDAKPPEITSAELPDEIQRFDIHQRLQHGLMASSFTVLVLTGWPLSAHGYPASQFLTNLFGGMEGCSLTHRIAAVVLIVASVYHLIYLTVLAKRRTLPLSMLPTPGDIRDVAQNLLFFVGLRKERPEFPRFTYFEKFDYWAVFWGVVIMVGSGLIRWFPVATMKVLPPWAYQVAYFAHADEALLAGLAIFVWHFYNVHLRPQVFPMSWVFITGRISREELEDDHGKEYAALVKKAAESDGKES